MYEHVMPLAGVLRALLANPPVNTASLRQVLDQASERVIITASEDRALTSAGYRDSAPDPGDPWSRYRVIELTRLDFGAFN